jgi:hypothetical protein
MYIEHIYSSMRTHIIEHIEIGLASGHVYEHARLISICSICVLILLYMRYICVLILLDAYTRSITHNNGNNNK